MSMPRLRVDNAMRLTTLAVACLRGTGSNHDGGDEVITTTEHASDLGVLAAVAARSRRLVQAMNFNACLPEARGRVALAPSDRHGERVVHHRNA